MKPRRLAGITAVVLAIAAPVVVVVLWLAGQEVRRETPPKSEISNRGLCAGPTSGVAPWVGAGTAVASFAAMAPSQTVSLVFASQRAFTSIQPYLLDHSHLRFFGFEVLVGC